MPQDNAFILDSLIDHIIATGWSASDMYWVRRRQWQNIKPKENEGAYKKYLELYNQLIPDPSFNNIPVPMGWNTKLTSQNRAQAPTSVSEAKFREREEAKKMEDAKKKEEVVERKRKRESERKRAEKEEEKKKKEKEKLKKLEKQRVGEKKKKQEAKKSEKEDENVGEKDGEKEEAGGSESGSKRRKRKVQTKTGRQKKRKVESEESEDETEEEDEEEMGLVYDDDSCVEEDMSGDEDDCYSWNCTKIGTKGLVQKMLKDKLLRKIEASSPQLKV